MNGTFFYIGLGLGLACACGLRPFLPLLLAGALASAGALGVEFGAAGDTFHFLQEAWWLLPSRAFPAALTLLGFSGERGRESALSAAITGIGIGAGALLFAGTLAAHGDMAWPGLLGGILAAILAQRASGPVIARARMRLPDRGAREALTVYLDAASLLLAALVAAVHPLGYVAVALLAWFLWRGRSRVRGDRYAGLRILRR
jgi:Domain of unknown function (DUF4126)